MNRTHLVSVFKRSKISPLASHAGFGPEECRAVRRHAERELACGNHDAAADSFRMALVVEPGDASSWSGLAATVRALGQHDEAIALDRMARIVARSFS